MTDYFISDAHLYPEGRSHPGREPLNRFLDQLAAGEPGNLWILGDLFDFWFEYGSHAPTGFARTLCRLRRLSETGWRIPFIPGNHDWWCGEKLAEASGMEIIRKSIHRETIQGLVCLLSHGDGLGKGDTGYRLVRPLLRSPVSVRLFSLLHPSLATWLATRFSNTSKRILRRKIDSIPRYLSTWVTEQGREGIDLVITGHTHCPSLTGNQGLLHASLGDWISHFTYLTIRGGEIRLNEYKL